LLIAEPAAAGSMVQSEICNLEFEIRIGSYSFATSLA
jgi:hypothetical protein